MRNGLVLFGCCLIAVGLSGCGSNPESIMKNQITLMNELADAIEKNEPESKIAEIKGRMEQNGKKLDNLNLSDDEKKKLFEKHKDELVKATKRLGMAMFTRGMKDLGSAFPGMPDSKATP